MIGRLTGFYMLLIHPASARQNIWSSPQGVSLDGCFSGSAAALNRHVDTAKPFIPVTRARRLHLNLALLHASQLFTVAIALCCVKGRTLLIFNHSLQASPTHLEISARVECIVSEQRHGVLPHL